MDKEDKKIVIYWNFKKTLTLICGIIFIPLLSVFLFSLTLKNTLLSPQYYKNNLKKIDAYNRIVNQGIPSLILEMHISDNGLTDTLAKEISVLLIQKLVDPGWLEQLTTDFIDKTVVFLQDPNKEITLNLGNANKYLTKFSAALQIAEEIIPACDQVSNEKLLSSVLPGFSPDCSQMSTNLDEIKKDLGQIRQEVDKINLGIVKADQMIVKTNSFINNLRQFINYLNIYFWISLIGMIILISVIVTLEWKNPAFILEAVSLFTAIGSFLTLILSLLADKIVPKTLGNQEILLSTAIRSIIDDFLQITISGVFQLLQTYTSSLLIISLAVYCLTLFLKGKKIKFFQH